jgi:hypothetical protein
MTKKKILLVGLSVLGAVTVLAQAVWADSDDAKKPAQTQVTAAEHAAHHPDTSAAGTVADQPQSENEQGAMQDMMKDGNANMNDKMKMMADGSMDEMIKMMNNGSMDDMMKMMDTPEDKQLMEKCSELLEQQPAASVQS